MAAIAGEVLHLIPQSLNRIEFGTVGRQGQQMNPFGQAGIARARVKARLILNDHVLGGRIAGGDLPEKVPAEIQIHRGHEPELGIAFQDFQRSVDILPFIPRLLRNHHPLAAQGPAPPALRMQPKAAFIRHPDLHRFILGQGQLLKPLFQFGAEGGGGRRVLQNVSRARNPQRAVGFSQPPIHGLGRPFDPVRFLEPGGHLSGGAPTARLQPRDQLLLHLGLANRTALARRAFPFQQPSHPAGLKMIQPDLDGGAGAAR
jgi:hypothetical protein